MELKKKIISQLKEINFENFENFDCIQLRENILEKGLDLKKQILEEILTPETKSEYEKEILKYKAIESNLENYESILFHKNVGKIQKMAYNEHLNVVSKLNGKILIELDFKQKIIVGLSPRQISNEYYKQIIRSCLGMKNIRFNFYLLNNIKRNE